MMIKNTWLLHVEDYNGTKTKPFPEEEEISQLLRLFEAPMKNPGFISRSQLWVKNQVVPMRLLRTIYNLRPRYLTCFLASFSTVKRDLKTQIAKSHYI